MLKRGTEKGKGNGFIRVLLTAIIVIAILLIVSLVAYNLALDYYIGLMNIQDDSDDDYSLYEEIIEDVTAPEISVPDSSAEESDIGGASQSGVQESNGIGDAEESASGEVSPGGSSGGGSGAISADDKDASGADSDPDIINRADEDIDYIFIDYTDYAGDYDLDAVTNILLIGADLHESGYGRADTIMLLSINTDNRTIVLTSFMRDTYVGISGYRNNRINASYAFGGPKLLIKTIYNNFKLDIDYYAVVDIDAFSDVVNVIGGVDVQVSQEICDALNKRFECELYVRDENGNVHLTAETAIGFVQQRCYSNGDFTRTLNQRLFMSACVNKLKTMSIFDINTALNVLLPQITTNMSTSMIKALVNKAAVYMNYSVESARIPCDGSWNYATIRGMSVITVDFRKNINYLYETIYK
ncbi:MAG: LCP family protein [Clostridiales bacterium]|nr:LCP family protein [Clostridiales bacterium]